MSHYYLDLVRTGLHASRLRHETIASNIANVNTPDYKAKRVAFEELFASSQETIKGAKTHPHHLHLGSLAMELIEPKVTVDANLRFRPDGNSVDMDHETALMAKNQVRYEMMVMALNHHFQRISRVVSERV